jgi:hypothetical protein
MFGPLFDILAERRLLPPTYPEAMIQFSSARSRFLLLVIPGILVLANGAYIVTSLAQNASRAAEAPTATDPEAKLIAIFANATMKGRWAPLKDGQLGEEKEDTYQIVSAQKLDGERWQINARIQYHGQSVDMPVPATVKWAGDTAVLLFDDINIGTPRRYSARLMIHGDNYSGTWSGGDHGGMLYGVITRAAK